MKLSITLATLSIAGFLALGGCSKGPSEAELAELAALKATAAENKALAEAESKRAAQLAEANELAKIAADKAAEAEATRRAELAAQFERDKAEKARLASMVAELNTQAAAHSQSQAQLEAELAKAKADRLAATKAAEAEVRRAQAELAAAEANKAAEIQAAREAAIAEATAQMESRAKANGRTSPTELVTDRRRESISAFLSVDIAERNFRNNTRRAAQRREAGE